MKIIYKTPEVKNRLYASEYEQIPAFLASLKNDDGKIDFDWEVQCAAGLWDCGIILKAEAKVCRNTRVCNRYTENSGYLDIEFEILAWNGWDHFDRICCCLSDIWDIGADGNNEDDIRSRMFHERFSRDH